MFFEGLFSMTMAEAGLAKIFSMMGLIHVMHETREIVDPCIMPVPIKEIDFIGKLFATNEHWKLTLTFFIKNGKNIYFQISNIFDFVNLPGVYWVV